MLMGLVVQEKLDIAREIAQRHAAAGERVMVLDNVARLSLDPQTLPPNVDYQRVADELTSAHIHAQAADTLVLAASEQAHPDALFERVAWLDNVTVTTVALIDTRTCDCFPHLRQRLEALADTVIHLPYTIADLSL